MEYNTARPKLGIKEYGRHIQKMVDFVVKITDRDKRNKQARVVVEMMALLNPQIKQVENYKQILWDHLHAMANFQLDVDSPYPAPTKLTYKSKPEPLPYPNVQPKHAHLGRNLEQFIDIAMNEEDPAKKDAYSNLIAYYMKLCYTNWHKEVVHDEVIRAELANITKGELDFTNAPKIKHKIVFEPIDYVGTRKQMNKKPMYKSNGGPNNGAGNRNNNGGGGKPGNNKNFKKRY